MFPSISTIWRVGLCCVLAGAAVMSGASRAGATEEPQYEVTEKDGAFELRRYDGMIVASVTVTGDQAAARNQGFQPLADYIFGNNTAREKIAMTTPVTQGAARSGEKIAMTAPVTRQPVSDDSWEVHFMMPSAWTMDTLPTPNNPDVTLKELPPQTMAVVTYRGRSTLPRQQEQEAALRAWMAQRGYVENGMPSYAFYDPPWTPGPLRRNEVMIPVAKNTEDAG